MDRIAELPVVRLLPARAIRNELALPVRPEMLLLRGRFWLVVMMGGMQAGSVFGTYCECSLLFDGMANGRLYIWYSTG